MCSYSVIEGCVRQSSFSPIKKNMKTEMETIYTDTFYDCTEEICEVIEKHYPEILIEDTERVNVLVQEELAEASRRQARENIADELNGGSK